MGTQITLPDSLTIHQIDEHFTQLLEQLNIADESIELNGAAVESIDTSGLQAVLALIRHAQSKDNQISWQSSSDVLKQSAAKLGLSEAMLLN